jgi:hypothetical protein
MIRRLTEVRAFTPADNVRANAPSVRIVEAALPGSRSVVSISAEPGISVAALYAWWNSHSINCTQPGCAERNAKLAGPCRAVRHAQLTAQRQRGDAVLVLGQQIDGQKAALWRFVWKSVI